MGTLKVILFLILMVSVVRLYSAGWGGTITRVSVASNGTESDGQSYYAAISADGRSVVFDSDATTLVPNEISLSITARPTKRF
jgi:hypothetical protein